MTRFRTFVIAAGLSPLMGIAAAQAGTITETGTVATQTTDFSNVVFGNVTNGANSNTFAGFNSALGTLTEVDVTLTLNGTETGTLTNTAAGSENFQFSSFSGGLLSRRDRQRYEHHKHSADSERLRHGHGQRNRRVHGRAG